MRLAFHQTHLYRLVNMAYPMGFEPMTYRVGVCHSIQLGYGYTLDTVHCSTLERNEQYPKTNISS